MDGSLEAERISLSRLPSPGPIECRKYSNLERKRSHEHDPAQGHSHARGRTGGRLKRHLKTGCSNECDREEYPERAHCAAPRCSQTRRRLLFVRHGLPQVLLEGCNGPENGKCD